MYKNTKGGSKLLRDYLAIKLQENIENHRFNQ